MRGKKNGQTADTQNPISKERRRLGDALSVMKMDMSGLRRGIFSAGLRGARHPAGRRPDPLA
jgi:hypothetical protein